MPFNQLIRPPIGLDRVLPHHYFQTARWAVLTPFDGTIAKRGKFHVPKVYHKLWEAWVDLVVWMSADVGWPDKANPLWVANCPYFGVKGHTRGSCHQARICPFCWGRERVIRPYCTVDSLLPEGKIQKAGHRLVEFCSLYRFDYMIQGTLGNSVEDEPLHRLLKFIRDKIEHEGCPEIRLVDHAGAFVSYSVDLHPTYRKPGYSQIYFRRSGLMLVRKDHEVYQMPGTTYEDEAPVDQPSLMWAFSQICRYPVGWLKHGEPWQIRQYLDGLAGCKMMQRYGGWYRNSNSEIEKED